MPTDRGFVVISDEEDGSKTVLVCAGVERGEPQDVYAMYVRTSVNVHPEVALTKGPSGQYTAEIVEVNLDDTGLVQVAGPQRVRSLKPE